MASQNDIDLLAQLYLDARERLHKTITGPTGVGTKTYANSVLQQLDRELKALKKASDRYVDVRVPATYKAALADLYRYFNKHHLRMKRPESFASLHNDAIHTIARDMQYQLDDALITVGRQVKRYVELAQDEALRQAGLRQAGIKAASGGTVQDMQNALIKELQEQGFMTVQYGSGPKARQVPVDVYAGMVSRSTTREAGNTARLNQLTANGYDLVKMTEHYPTCEVCAPLQGRVYSISGKDPRFPPLSKAFGAYNNVHPNCRHVVTPWVESMHTPEEVQAAVDFSSKPFEDTRSAQEVALYNHQQDQNRKARETIYQYERYKAALGDDAPKSYMAFARLKKAGGDKWGILQAQYRGMGYYNKAIKREPEITKAITETASAVGMTPAGLEYRIKSKESYLRKIEANYSPEGNEYDVKDILRYTYTASGDQLADKAIKSIETLGTKGYNTVGVKNSWRPNSPYCGINTTIRSSSGQTFELQYHTPESFELKNGPLHELYEKQRVIKDEFSPEFIALKDEMIRLSNQLDRPKGIEDVK